VEHKSSQKTNKQTLTKTNKNAITKASNKASNTANIKASKKTGNTTSTHTTPNGQPNKQSNQQSSQNHFGSCGENPVSETPNPGIWLTEEIKKSPNFHPKEFDEILPIPSIPCEFVYVCFAPIDRTPRRRRVYFVVIYQFKNKATPALDNVGHKAILPTLTQKLGSMILVFGNQFGA
jgi:hypothetical protein